MKYATGSDPQNPACGSGQTLPNCGALLLGQHASLDRIMFSEHVDLSPTFKPTELNYQLNISPQITQLQLTPIASNPASTISISRNGIEVGTTSSVITLDKDTSITIAVSASNQRPAQYQLAVNYRHAIIILGTSDETIDEGEAIMLNASHSLDAAEEQISYRWTQTTGKTILSETADESASLLLFIPADYVPTNEDYAGLGLNIEVSDGKTTLNKDINLMIAKKDNGSITVDAPNLNAVESTAPEIDLNEDPDGAGKSLSYQWQHRLPNEDAEWMDIDGATDKTYTIPTSAEWYTEYRVLIKYTDRQGYETIATSEATRYSPETVIPNFAQSATPQRAYPEDAIPQRDMHSQDVSCTSTEDLDRDGILPSMDIDDDNNGLIEICYLEDLNAIRFVPDGSGYKSDAMATTNTTGCPADGCNGYELARDLDFKTNTSYRYETVNKAAWTVDNYDDSEDNGWQPIGNSNSNTFRAIFEGNGHTISNLMINRPSASYIGLFSYIQSTRTEITNVGLLNVNVIGTRYVGGLVGRNNGFIMGDYVTGEITGISDGANAYAYVGGLVGGNSGTIMTSYTMAKVTGISYSSFLSVSSVGGLVGINREGSITNSYATGEVEGISAAAVHSYSFVGGLVGENSIGGITNSHATGEVTGTSSAYYDAGPSYSRVGSLVGENSGTITGSYATGKITGTSSASFNSRRAYSEIGGLVGGNSGTITNSHATGGVTGISYCYDDSSYSNAGGLVGENSGTITNSYATGEVTGISYCYDDNFSFNIGGLVGSNIGGTIMNSYATGEVKGMPSSSRVGGLVGFNLDWVDSTITNNYWDIDTSKITTSAGGTSKTTVELQPATAQDTYQNQPYYNWSTDNWDFGNDNQYPVLKFADNPETNSRECRNAGETTKYLPVCGNLLLPSLRYGLSELQLVSGNFSPDFSASVLNYNGTVVNTRRLIRLKPVAANPDANISIMAKGRSMNVVSNTLSGGIGLKKNAIVEVTIMVENGGATTQTILYTLYLGYQEFNGDVDRDDDGLIEIDDLEGLNAIRYQPDGSGYRASKTSPKIMVGCPAGGCKGYELMKNLDFNDSQSYSDASNKITWTSGEGWRPIRYLDGIFEGNGYIISNLMINSLDTSADYIGLFGHTKSGIEIANLGLLNVKIKSIGSSSVIGGLVGVNFGIVTNSYVVGSIIGDRSDVGGLVGVNSGIITNSYATGSVATGYYAGGLVGANHGSITSSYATGTVLGNSSAGGLGGVNGGTITNSYATGMVSGNYQRSGLVSRYHINYTVTNSYWNTETSGVANQSRTTRYTGIGKTTKQLQSATAQDQNEDQPYYRWSTTDWDFGANNQYPALKYAQGPNQANPACGIGGKPVCGKLLPGQRFNLDQLTISGNTFSVRLDPRTLNHNVEVGYDVKEIELNTTATDTFIRIISNTMTTEVNTSNTASITIPRTLFGDTIITVEVTKGNQHPTPYIITVLYPASGPISTNVAVGVEVNNTQKQRLSEISQVREGDSLKLSLAAGSCNRKCEWQVSDTSLLSATTSLSTETLEIGSIPTDYLAASESTRSLTITVAVLKEESIASRTIELSVKRRNNGQVSPLGHPSLRGSLLVAPQIVLASDPDGAGRITGYQWQRLVSKSWINIRGASRSSYVPEGLSQGEAYRVRISYTDGQGYPKRVDSKPAKDVDRDNDGLIEISTLEELDAMRHNLLGTSHKETAEVKGTNVGCFMDDAPSQCIGYELAANLDFDDDASYSIIANKVIWTTTPTWHPIGSADEPFNAIFDGNGYAISNLKIDHHSRHIGLFAKTGRQSLITNVALLDVDIVGREVADIADDVRIVVGGLVGDNEGMIKHSFVDGMIEQILVNDRLEEMKSVAGGGIAGMNSGSIEHSRAFGIVKGIFRMGGLVGQNNSGGAIKHSYAANNTMGTRSIGGLVGVNSMVVGSVTTASIICSHASGKVTGADNVGGLVGSNLSMGEIVESYATGDVGTGNTVGGLVGFNRRGGQIRNSSSFGGAGKKITATSFRGALVGRGDGEIIGSHATITSRACGAVEK